MMNRVVLAVAALFLCACTHSPGTAGKVVQAQAPGVATGAGATFTGPTNSAAPSTQTAQRRVAYFPPGASAPAVGPRHVESPAAVPAVAASGPTQAAPEVPVTIAPEVARPAWIEENVATTYGQRQDAAGIVKVATAAGTWGKARWFGILCILAAIGGLLYSHNNPEGYPVICWKVGGVGVFLAMFDPSPWWLLLLLIPALFYVAQKMNLLRIP